MGCNSLPIDKLQIKNLFKGKGILISEEPLCLCRLLVQPRLYFQGKNITSGTHHYSTLFFAIILTFVGIKHLGYLFRIYIHDFGEKKFIKNIFQFFFNQNVGILTQSITKITYLKNLSSAIDTGFFPYCSNEITGYNHTEVSVNQYFYAEGYTIRNYQLLIECAAQLPHEQFIIICSHLNTLPSRIPTNIIIFRDLNSNEYHSFIAGSKAAVLALKDDVGTSGEAIEE